MPKRATTPAAEELAKKYTVEYCELLLREDPAAVDRLWSIVQGKVLRSPKQKPAPKVLERAAGES